MRSFVRTTVLAGLAAALAVGTTGCSGGASAASSTSAVATSSVTTSPAVRLESLEGELGGMLYVDGVLTGRGKGSTRRLFDGLVAADRQEVCMLDGTRIDREHYGSLTLYLPVTPVRGEFGATYPVGEVAGWRLTSPDVGHGMTMTGPKGVTFGTSLAALKKQFAPKDWHVAQERTFKGKRVFSLYAGDMSGADFELGADGRVSAITSGLTCP